MKIIAITQMRMGSTRLPGKVLKEIDGRSLMDIHLSRVAQANSISKIIIATTTDKSDDAIAERSIANGYTFYRGSIEDVLSRFYYAALPENPDYVVRVTGDCPLLDPALIDAVVMLAVVNGADYVSNVLEEHFPDGQDVEVISWKTLEKAFQEATLLSEREHVTPYIRNNSSYKGGKLFTSLNFPCVENFNAIRMTVDEPQDLELVSRLINDMGINRSWKEYTDYVIDNGLMTINGSIIRNEGLIKSMNAEQNG